MIGAEEDLVIVDDATPLFHQHHEHDMENQVQSSSVSAAETTTTENVMANKKYAIGKVDQYMAAEFKCGKCKTHNTHVFLKKSYEQGEVIVRCPGCKHLHLMADNKGWFGEAKNVEEILKAQGKPVRRMSANQVLEATTGSSKTVASESVGTEGPVFNAQNLSVIQDMIDQRVARTRERIVAEEQKLKRILSAQAEEDYAPIVVPESTKANEQ